MLKEKKEIRSQERKKNNKIQANIIEVCFYSFRKREKKIKENQETTAANKICEE